MRLLTLPLLLLPLTMAAQTPRLTIGSFSDPTLYAARPYGVRPMEGKSAYTQIAPDGRRILLHSFRTGEQTDVLFDADRTVGEWRLEQVEGYVASPDGRHLLLQTETQAVYRRSFTAQYYLYDTQTRRLEPLSRGGAQQAPTFSPDGRWVAFAREGDLFLRAVADSSSERRITSDGKRGSILNGIPDWVYEEEFSTDRSFCFTAASEQLCWVRYDESLVPEYAIPMYRGQAPSLDEHEAYPGAFRYKYPVAGERNSSVSVHAYDLARGTVSQLAVPVDPDGYVPALHTTADPARVAVVTLNRHQNRMRLFLADARNGAATLLLEERDSCYVSEAAYTQLRFHEDGFVLTSERSGRKQLYLYGLDGQLRRQLSHPDYDVTAFYGYNPATGDTYYQAAPADPLRRAVCCTDRRGRTLNLTKEKGTHSATLSADFRYFMDTYSTSTIPYVTTLRDTKKGEKQVTLMDNAALRQRMDTIAARKEFFSFTTSEGVELHGWMMLPRDFDPSRRYPVLLYQYGGPGSQEVKDSWNMGFLPGGLLETFMAERGYITACVDGRGTGARGRDFEKCTYLRLGQLEARDQVETALYLGRQAFVDAARIGIWGWSFGGFNTLMAMSEGRPVFKAGVAVAAPTNWKYYDTIYTERYMRTPRENPGYDDNPITRAPKLHGELLLVHGTADDNVHLRNCSEYTEALVQAGIQHDMQLYTNRNHFILGGRTREHLYTRLVRFFLEHL